MELNHRREALQASALPLSYSPIICLGSRARTCDLLLPKQAFYQLNYTQNYFLSIKYRATNITTVVKTLRVDGWNRTNVYGFADHRLSRSATPTFCRSGKARTLADCFGDSNATITPRFCINYYAKTNNTT